MSKFVVLVVLIGLLSVPMMAADYPRAEVFGGYQYLRLNNAFDSGTDVNANGWNAAVTGNLSKSFGVTGDFSGSYATIQGVSAHVYTYGGGPVVNLNAGGKFNPFVHGIFGAARLTASESGVSVSKTGFTMMFGGGVDVAAKRGIGLRLIQADWVYYHFGAIVSGSSSFSSKNNVRVSTGIVIRF